MDLGGYTLAAPADIADAPLLIASSKGWSQASGLKVFPTSVVISNGTMRHNNGGIVKAQTWDSVNDGTPENSIANKTFSLTFNNVTFGFTEGANSVGLLVHTAHDGNNKTSTTVAPFNFTYNDCVFRG